MIPHADRNGAVSSASVKHRAKPGDKAAGDELAALSTLEALHARIQAARTLTPAPRDRHCLDCFQRGRDAAIRAILGE